MPLTYSGDSHTNPSGTIYRAVGSKNDEKIVVNASAEAIRDRGEAAVRQKGSDKYDADQVNDSVVQVRAVDFA
jgi:hypothetical protein